MKKDKGWPAGLLKSLREARHVVVFTGAGISRDSGIPTFREKVVGLWDRFDVKKMSTPEGFKKDPDLVWGWYETLRLSVMAAQPNAGHLAIAKIQEYVSSVTVITQNVDDLHERAGSAEVIHLHGSLFAPRCNSCGRPFMWSPGAAPVSGSGQSAAPHCSTCRNVIRPGVVWFGESLPENEFENASAAVDACDAFFCIGTSVQIYPAAGLPFQAAARGIPVIQVNPEPTDLNSGADMNFEEGASRALPEILRQVWGESVRLQG